MTPLEKGQELLAGVEAVALAQGHELPGKPRSHYAQIGNLVVACAGVTVTLVGLNPETLNPSNEFGSGSVLKLMDCGVGQIGVYVIAIARECANIAHDDGTDNPEAIAALSPDMDADSTVLWEFCQNYEAWLTKQWTIRFAIDGALAVTSAQLTIGID